MKFEIGQIVYFLDSCRSEFFINTMQINKIEMENQLNAIYYSGYDPEDTGGIPHDRIWEALLFSSKEELITFLEKQTQKLKDEQTTESSTKTMEILESMNEGFKKGDEILCEFQRQHKLDELHPIDDAFDRIFGTLRIRPNQGEKKC